MNETDGAGEVLVQPCELCHIGPDSVQVMKRVIYFETHDYG